MIHANRARRTLLVESEETKPVESSRSKGALGRPASVVDNLHMTRKNASKPKKVKSRTKRSSPAQAEIVPSSSEAGFSIVGIGASAGGLEALEQFFEAVPAKSGLAFVVVQHMDPTHVGMLPEILQRSTSMKVTQVRDRTEVRPDSVYVIPPDKYMSILHGKLHLFKPPAPRGLRLPINFFLRSLAEDQRERSVGVILSGMGTDGTLGLRAIKEQAGVVLVQEPTSAKFDGMPRSAIDCGMADVVAPAAELPARILRYARHAPLLNPLESPDESSAHGQLEKVVFLLRSKTGHDFSLYKRSTLHRRIERRMGLHHIKRIDSYVQHLRTNPQEVDILFKELLIGVTRFFRDPAAWDQLRDEAIPALFQQRSGSRMLRAWVPGCSTGEEAYSLAIIFKEALERHGKGRRFALQIFATDLDRDAVEKARQGVFPITISEQVLPDRLSRFFIEEKNHYRITNEIREQVIFAPQNLVMDPPFTKLDILSCRNLLIYLGPETQKKIIPLFHYALNSGGVLFLGSAESISNHNGLFASYRGKSRIFLRKDAAANAGGTEFPSGLLSRRPQRSDWDQCTGVAPESLQSLAERWILEHHAPAAVLVNDQGDILFINGHTGQYLEPVAGRANWNIFVMAKEGLRFDLNSTFEEAKLNRSLPCIRRSEIVTHGTTHFVNLTVQFLPDPKPLRGLAMVVFTAEAAPPSDEKRIPARGGTRVREMERELQRTRERARQMHESMQNSQEEIKSMNEELQSTNEELQSTNEELTTSKEEMQSLNEELQTVNAELQSKLDELVAASDDMKNLLNSTEIATVFLDNALCVRRFTEHATQIIKLIPGDVGRPITDLATNLSGSNLAEDSREVLRTLIPVEKTLEAGDGRWFRMRLMPYRTMDNRIDGVVITFTRVNIAGEQQARAPLQPSEKQIRRQK